MTSQEWNIKNAELINKIYELKEKRASERDFIQKFLIIGEMELVKKELKEHTKIFWDCTWHYTKNNI